VDLAWKHLNLDFHFGALVDNLLRSPDAFIHAGSNLIKTLWRSNPMGEKQNEPFQLSFNASLKVDFQGSRVTSDGGLILVRELDERLALGDLITEHLTDSRRGKNTQLPLADLFRQSVYSRMAGYEDVNDAERLSQDPAFRLIG
jgi:Transposase DDE domain group 1